MLIGASLLLILLITPSLQEDYGETKKSFNAIETFDTAMREQCARYDGGSHHEPYQTKSKNDNSSALQAVLARDVLSACAPLFSLIHPQVTERLAVTNLNPLKFTAHVRVPQTGEAFSFEGLVCDDGFDANEAAAVCRSLGFSGKDNMFMASQSWSTNDVTCVYKHERSTAQTILPCRYLIDDLICPIGASNLQACTTRPLFENNCGSNEAVKVYCN